ncbi:MAG TPA: hypothetical protein VFY20_08380 [Gemmatimonadales bacterium]|nr:hypothetical protein [Gemmatimonadales bacterium]
MRRVTPLLRRLVLAGFVGCLWAGSAVAQQSRWVVRSSATADLWFHGLALARFTGFGTQPLYRPAYPSEVRRVREAAGRTTTRLEREADGFREAFVADSAFEVLHFVPLYFVAADPEEMLDALARVARDGRESIGELPKQSRFGAVTVASVLATPQERAVLGRFVAALREEWAVYRTERGEAADRRAARLATATRVWQDEVAPTANAFLQRERLDGGVIVAVPSLGAEGRFFAGDPGDRSDNIVAVALDAADDGQAVAWLALKELSFPATREALAQARQLPADRVAAERLTGSAAAQAGSLLLEGGPPAGVARYRAALEHAGACRAPFDECYPLSSPARTALAARLR